MKLVLPLLPRTEVGVLGLVVVGLEVHLGELGVDGGRHDEDTVEGDVNR